MTPCRFSPSSTVLPNSTSAPALPRTITRTSGSYRLRIFSALATGRVPMIRSCACFWARGNSSRTPSMRTQNLLGLRSRPLRLLPLLVQQIPVPPRMATHHAHQLLHLPEHPLASFLTAGTPGLLRHGDTQPIHAQKEPLQGFHAPAQASLANHQRGFHERAHSVSQQHPVGGEMDVGLEAGAIQKILLQVQRFLES